MAEAEHTPLRRINRKALSLVRYEACLEAGGPAPVYAWPWFLDVMAGAWEALVWDDYRYVMPVAHRRKWGISYVYQPMFAQQLGIYPSPPPGVARAFYEFLASRYPYIRYSASTGAEQATAAGFSVTPLHTRTLPLHLGYAAIAAHYDDYITQNLKKARGNQISVVSENHPGLFFAMLRKAREIPVPPVAWRNFRKLMEATLPDGRGLLLAARTPGGQPLAAAFFILWREKAYYMAVASDPQGRELRAGFAILDTFFREHAGKPLTFDFEGSSVEGVDRFFAAFGAGKTPYYLFHLNRLPRILRLIKK